MAPTVRVVRGDITWLAVDAIVCAFSAGDEDAYRRAAADVLPRPG